MTIKILRLLTSLSISALLIKQIECRGGTGSRVINYKNWGDVIYGWSLMEGPLNEKSVSPFSYHVELCLRYVSHHCRIISLISDAS